uniref:EF-hand domain-containing protein n=1 Tax=Craspedostauros australis TaxID=1486917 RepID=A0A7S0F743_9STRA|mmetsp:Transcript_9842/g.26861  ORF Transcript_9842/g.26861 Transcript_9842/m.26861 type:complete len:127 (+) Transcript_9842:157-537(+)
MVENKDAKDAVEAAIDKVKPLIAKVSFGGVMGFCSGYAMKKVGKAVAVTIGLGFFGLQSAAYLGYIDVNWNKIVSDAVKPLDATGDGKVDAEDVKVYWKKLKSLLVNGLPNAGGFSVGFLYGVKQG